METLICLLTSKIILFSLCLQQVCLVRVPADSPATGRLSLPVVSSCLILALCISAGETDAEKKKILICEREINKSIQKNKIT